MSRASLETFHKIKSDGTLSKRRLETFASLLQGEKNSTFGLTHNEIGVIASRSGLFPPDYRNNVVARLCELEAQGVVRRVLDTSTCPISKETCTTWETVDFEPTKLTRKTLPTKVELIETLCQQLEAILRRVNAVTEDGKLWKTRTEFVLSDSARHRKKK
jgi:hypothetical protein